MQNTPGSATSVANKDMERALKTLQTKLANIQVEANPLPLYGLYINVSGEKLTFRSVASVKIQNNTLLVKPFDVQNIKALEHSINKAHLQFTVTNAASVLMLSPPALSEEKRKQLSKLVSTLTEECYGELREARQKALSKSKAFDPRTKGGFRKQLQSLLNQKRQEASAMGSLKKHQLEF